MVSLNFLHSLHVGDKKISAPVIESYNSLGSKGLRNEHRYLQLYQVAQNDSKIPGDDTKGNRRKHLLKLCVFWG